MSGRCTSERVDILGCGIDRVDMGSAIARLEALIASGSAHQVLLVPVNSVMAQRRDPGFRAICAEASLVLPDGVPLLWASRFLGSPIPGRVAGADLLEEFSKTAARRGYSFFFLGSRKGIPQKLAERLVEGHPGLKVVGAYAPPVMDEFTPQLDARMVGMINAAKPDVLWVGFGAPKQERWIHRHLPELRVKVAIGIGAAFDWCSGAVRRAPRWMQRCGLEWFFRFLIEPRRLFKRYFVEAAPFFPLVLAQRFGSRRVGRGTA